MTEGLTQHWVFEDTDWITAVDVIVGKYIFVGGRDGRFYVLDWHNAPLLERQYASWLGTLRVVEIDGDEYGEDCKGIYVFCGTKNGTFRCLRLNPLANKKLDATQIYEFKARNTIREIDFTRVNDQLWIAFGSEDKHLYIARFGDLLRDRDYQPIAARVNGWIRSVAFCKAPTGNENLIAAGCGDKRLYLFRLTGEQYGNVLVNSKIHSILVDPNGKKIFCTSDAKKIYTISLDGDSYSIRDSINLPHRATKLVFLNRHRRRILAVCEDRKIYVVDIGLQRPVSSVSTGHRVFSIKEVDWHKTDFVLIGEAYGKLGFYMCDPDGDRLPDTPCRLKGQTQEFEKDLDHLAEVVLYGPKAQSIEVGIGRFIHYVSSTESDPGMCIVGTDEGDVIVIEVSSGKRRQEVYRILRNKRPTRIWSVYGYWSARNQLRVFAGTSNREICEYQVDFTTEPLVHSELGTRKLEEWPREIRPVRNGGPDEILASCENGDLEVLNAELAFQTNQSQVFRTGYAVRTRETYELLVGSDNKLITFLRGKETIWQARARDKVREVIIGENGDCIAVSEDRFLYIRDHDGRLKQRYKFPHRALCVDLYEDPHNMLWYVVGCGDGFVYFVNEDGFILYAYAFPDRIRDVKILPQLGEMIVACEDNNVYFCETMADFYQAFYGGNPAAAIDEDVKKLEQRIKKDGVRTLGDLPVEQKLLLLFTFDSWVQSTRIEWVVLLIDQCKSEILERDDLRLYYLYSKALVDLSFAENLFSAGLSRIEDFIRCDASRRNNYILHSLLAVVLHANLKSHNAPAEAQTLLDAIIAGLPPIDLDSQDNWIAEESVRVLYKTGFFDLGGGGFRSFFTARKIALRNLQNLMIFAERCELDQVVQSELIGLFQALRTGDLRSSTTSGLLALAAQGDEAITNAMNILSDMSVGKSANEVRSRVFAWIESVPLHEDVREVCASVITAYFNSESDENMVATTLTELMELKLCHRDFQISARDFLYFRICESFLTCSRSMHLQRQTP